MVKVQVFALFYYLTGGMYLSEINLLFPINITYDLFPNNTNFGNVSTYTHFSRPENRSKLH